MDHDDPDTTPRIRLAAALAAVTPHSPTLCEGWQARHLAAHVMLRERAPHRVVADLLRRAPVTGGHLGAVADDAAELPGYTRLVEEITQGPWRFSPMATRAATLTEFLVHEQDVRRGEALPSSPTRLGPRVSASVWRSCLAMARMRLLRHRDGHGLVLVTPEGPRAVVRRGATSAVLTGEPVELLLALWGRGEASLTQWSGDGEAVAALSGALR